MKRALGLAVVFGAGVIGATAAAESTASNPAFLGIGMQGLRGGECTVTSVIAGGPAEVAHLHPNDTVVALDGVMINGCDSLTALIVAHEPGEQVRLDVVRDNRQLALLATLSTRASVVQRAIGQTLDGIARAPGEANPVATDYEDEHSVDLSDLGGQTTMLAWADLTHCGGCASLIRKVVDVSQHRARDVKPPQVIAVTKGDPVALHAMRLYVGAPLVVAPATYFERAALDEENRVYFMVLDRGGIVRFVAPISPEDEASEAAIDDLLAAAEQAERARRR